MNDTPFQAACGALKKLGLSLRCGEGAYRVNYRGGSPVTEYVTDDLAEAVNHAREMAKEVPPLSDPPMGPTGGNASRRAIMYRHNRKLATRRRTQSSKHE